MGNTEMRGFFFVLIFSLLCVHVLSSSSSSPLHQETLLSDVKQGDSWRNKIRKSNVGGGGIPAKESAGIHYTIARGGGGGGGACGGGFKSMPMIHNIPVKAGHNHHKGAAASGRAGVGSCAVIATVALAFLRPFN